MPLYSTPPVTYNQCSSAITCIDHPATIDLSRLASVLGAPAASLDNVPLPGPRPPADHPQRRPAGVVERHRHPGDLGRRPELGRDRQELLGRQGAGERSRTAASASTASARCPTNAYLWFQTLPGAGPATPGPVQTSCVSTLPSGTVVGGAALDDGTGYYEVDAAGDVAAFGAATCYGALTGVKLNQPIVGMAVDRATGGYWLVASDGGVFAFNAPYPRLDRGIAPEQAGGRHDRHAERDRLLAGRLRRRGVLLRRPVPRLDRQHQAQQAGRRHGPRPGDRRLLAGGLRRRGVLLQRALRRLDRGASRSTSRWWASPPSPTGAATA